MIIDFKIKKSGGLLAEDCAVIAQRAGHFESEVYLIKDNKRVNAKSIMGVISLNLKEGETAYISISGIDEESCAKNLIELTEVL